MTDFLLVFSTFPSAEAARAAGRVLVAERLAACVNLLPGRTSIYVWQGEQHESEETLALVKSRLEHYAALEKRLVWTRATYQKRLRSSPWKLVRVCAAYPGVGRRAYLTRNTLV